jgi:hypothetical protein
MCPNILASGFRHLTFSEFKGLNSPDKGRSGWLCDPQVISFVSVEISFVSCTKVRIYKKKKGAKIDVGLTNRQTPLNFTERVQSIQGLRIQKWDHNGLLLLIIASLICRLS